MRILKSFVLAVILISSAQACAPEASGDPSFGIESKSAKTGELICVAVKANGFKDMLGMQFSVAWDDTVLQFKNTGSFKLKDMSESSFGYVPPVTDRLRMSWYSTDISPVSVANGTEIFNLCFEVIGKSGSSSAIEITSEPIAIELVQKTESGEDLAPVGTLTAGKITVE